jgi:hypothetical protein
LSEQSDYLFGRPFVHPARILSAELLKLHAGFEFQLRGHLAKSDSGSADYDARVRQNFVDAAHRLVSIPVQRRKRLAILRWLVEDFQPGRQYTEAEVNQIISRHHPDFAALRRYLIDEEMMQRQRGIYWRTGSVPNIGHDPPSWPGRGVAGFESG